MNNETIIEAVKDRVIEALSERSPSFSEVTTKAWGDTGGECHRWCLYLNNKNTGHWIADDLVDDLRFAGFNESDIINELSIALINYINDWFDGDSPNAAYMAQLHEQGTAIIDLE